MIYLLSYRNSKRMSRVGVFICNPLVLWKYCVLVYSLPYTKGVEMLFKAKRLARRADGKPKKDSYGYNYTEYTKLPWKELLPEEKRAKVAKYSAFVGVAAAAIWSIGTPNHDLPKEQVDAAVRKAAIDFYKTRTDEYKYAVSYLGYYEVGDIPTNSGGEKLLGFKTQKSISLKIGQTCLDGKAYDTRPSEIRGRARGDISAVASFDATPSALDVNPAGSNARGLSFTKTSNTLIPTPESVDTLGTYGCANGLVLWDGDPSYRGKQIQVIPFEEIAKTN